MSKESVILTNKIKKVIIIALTLFFVLKIGMIMGFELKDYAKMIKLTSSDNYIHVESLQKDKVAFFNFVEKELIEDLKNNQPIDDSISKLKSEMSKPYLKTNHKERHEILILSSGVILAAKNYAVNHQIPDEKLKTIQSLFKTYMSLDVKFSAGLLKRNGILFVPNREEISDFLSPAYTVEQMKFEKQNREDALRNFKLY